MMKPMVFLCAFAGLVVLPGAGVAQSLAEAARQAIEQREELGEATQVFTNQSLRPESPPAVPVRTPAEATTAGTPGSQGAEATAEVDVAAEAPSTETPAAGAPTDGEDYWRARLAAGREALARAQALEAALQSHVNSLTADFTARDDPAQRQVLFDDRQTALAELARMQDTITTAQQAIDDIREEGRRAGVPAGWFR